MSDYAAQFSSSPYYDQAYAMALQRGINPQFFVNQIAQESGFNPNAQNGNATGIAQFMPKTALDYGIDPTNPQQSLYAATAFDSDLLQQCNGDYLCVAQKYGTLPKSGSYTPGQLAVYNAANTANIDSGYNGSTFDKIACFAGFNSRCQLSPIALDRADKMVAGQLSIPGETDTCASIDVICNAKQWLTKSGANILGITGGLILLIVGLTMLHTGQSIAETTNKGISFVKSLPKLGAKAAAAALVAE